MSPPAWYCRATGILCLALAWVVFCLGLPSPAAPQMAVQWITHLAGLALAAVGVGWGLFPRVGHMCFVDRVPKMPLPLTGGIGRSNGNHEIGDQLTAMAGWIDRLALESGPCLGRSQATSVPRDRETLFDFLSPDWEDQLAQAFRVALEARSGKPLTALALQPVLWAECVTRELQDPHAMCSDLTALFASQAVKAWIESHSLAELLSFLQVDAERFSRFTARLASPHWPPSRVEPDMSASVVAVAKPLWDLLAPAAESPGSVPIVPLDWDARSDAVVVVRIVQGLAEGWRGYPGIPGQIREGVAESGEKKEP